MEAWSAHQLYREASSKLGEEAARSLQGYARRLIDQGLPVLFSLGHLSQITEVPLPYLEHSVCRQREAANYRMFRISKRSGGDRFIHAVSRKLFTVQDFINRCILQSVRPHAASYAFHPSGGIRKCASQHCGARWLLQFDLKDFFHSITESDVFKLFLSMGYTRLVAFEMARLCTTTRLPRGVRAGLPEKAHHRVCWDTLPRKPHLTKFSNGALGVLPQGAPTSPMLSNLVARVLDDRLQAVADEYGLIYTRYADDITMSAAELESRKAIGPIFKAVVSAIRGAGFAENTKKTRVAGPGSKKLVLGLLVDGEVPRLSREAYRRIERLLYAASKFGMEEAARHDGFRSTYGFANHLRGLLAYVKDVDGDRYAELRPRWDALVLPAGL